MNFDQFGMLTNICVLHEALVKCYIDSTMSFSPVFLLDDGTEPLQAMHKALTLT